jgi:hypothetical protein
MSNDTNVDYDKNVVKGLKTYLEAKKIYKSDKKKGLIYLKKSLKYFDNYKKNKDNYDEYEELIRNTENDCNKIIIDSINFKIDHKEDNEIDKKIFKIISKGQINRLKNIKTINFSKLNSNGLTPLHYCIKMGDVNMMKELLKKGGNIDLINKNGNTLLEYACLQKDPNFIQQIINYGGDMKKHLFFREGENKFILKKNGIDLAIITKIIISNCKENTNTNELNFIFNFIERDKKIGLNNYDLFFLINGLQNLLNKLGDQIKKTYLEILKDELNYQLNDTFVCPKNKIDIILTNLIPFINYPFNLSTDFILLNEIKYLVLKIIKKKMYNINDKNKKEIINELWKRYIIPNLFTQDFIGILTNRIISNIII